MSVKYTALRRLTISNPGHVPSSFDLEAGDIFSLEGNEGLRVDQMLQAGSIRRTNPPKPRPKNKAVSTSKKGDS